VLSSLAFTLIALAPLASLADESSDASHAHDHAHSDHDSTETIVVTATPLEHDRDELSVPVDRVDREEILDHLGSTLGETLSHLPGVATTGFTAGASRPVIRGQDAYRTEVLEDGLRTQDVSRESPDHAVAVNPLAAQRIEIVRGPATLRYGGGASAGVVNVITNRIPDALNKEDGVSGEIYGGIGLLANERDLAASLDGTKGDFAFHADGLFRRSNDYAIPNDNRPHIQSGTETESWVGSVGGAYVVEGGRFGASYTRLDSDYGLPEEGESVAIDMHADRFRFEGDLFDPVRGIQEIRVRGVYTDYEHDEAVEGVVGQTYRNKEFDGRIEVLHEPIAGFTGAVGFHAQDRDFEGEGEAAEFLSPTDRYSFALYVFEERPLLESLNLEAGFRVEQTKIQGTDASDLNRERHFTALSGALGLVLAPREGWTIGANGSISQRAPSQVELLARGAHEATGTFEIGDADLDLETAFTGDFRVEFSNERGRIEWASFVTHYQNYVFAGFDGVQVNEEGNAPAPGDDLFDRLFYGDRDALFYGFEVAGDVDLFEFDRGTLGIDGRFDYVRARFDQNAPIGGSQDLPRITPIRWGAGVFFQGAVADARIGFVRTESQDDAGDFETNTKSFTYLNASINYEIDFVEDVPISLSVVARNLTDVRGRNHVAFNKDEVLLPGRSIRFGLRARF
jgi:iron complex outermembrane receptor protein